MFTERRTLSREILERICAYCDRHTLTVLARQGKPLSEIALGELVANIPSIMFLLFILPLTCGHLSKYQNSIAKKQ